MPNQNTSIWTPQLIDRAIALLHERGNLNAAAESLSQECGMEVTYDSLRHALRARGIKPVNVIAGSGLVTRAVPRGFPPDAERTPAERVADDVKEFRSANEVRELRERYREAIAEKEATEQVVAKVGEAIQALPTVAAPKPPQVRKHTTVEDAVLLLSDLHIGEVVSSEEMGGLNHYDFETFVRRYQYLVEKVLSFTGDNMASYCFQNLHVFMLGDNVSGTIHDELDATNEVAIVDQAMLGALVVAQGLLDLARAFPKVTVSCVVGNHGRVTRKPYYKQKAVVSWDRVFYESLAMLLRHQSNVSFIIPRSAFMQVEVQGHLFQLSHGDDVMSWGGIPYYGLDRKVGRWAEINAASGKYVEYYCQGHFHRSAAMDRPRGEQILNSSMVGSSEFSAAFGLISEPSQLLFGVHERYGKSWSLKINLTDPHVEEVRYRYDMNKSVAEQLAAVS